MTRKAVITQPMISMGLQEKASPIAKVAVMSAVLGKMKEYQVMENMNPSFPTTERCANTAMKKKKIARLGILLINRAIE